MFATSSGFSRGCGGGCGGSCGGSCGNPFRDCDMNTFDSSFGMSPFGGTGCGGCGFTPNVTPITLPETTNCCHCRMLHEQPVIQPIENRTVRHHGFVPRVFVTTRNTVQDVVEPNTVLDSFGQRTMPLFPNQTNWMNTM